MLNPNLKQRIKTIADVFLEEEHDFLKISKAKNDYKEILNEFSNLDLEGEARNDLHFESGVAIGTTWAAMCLDDMLRTKLFVQGIFKAIENIKKTKQKTIHIFYAGTGPYATLILPLLAYYTPKEIQFTLLEINPISFNTVKGLMDKLDCKEYIRSYEMEDATKYEFKDTDIDLLISETMLRALRREQQVPIVLNLIRQLPKETVLIPQKIEIGLAYHKSTLNEKYIQPLDTIFSLTKESSDNLEMQNWQFPKRYTELIAPNNDYHYLVFTTTIQVYDDVWIKLDESGLTTVEVLAQFENIEGFKQVETYYTIGKFPKFEYQLIS